MGGKPRDPDYWKKWRAAHPAYRKREAERSRARKLEMTPEQRRRDRGQRKPIPPFEPLVPLFPHLQHGSAIAFWEDELRMDLAQERVLAVLEGRDPDRAVRLYRVREINWHNYTVPISSSERGQEGLDGEGSLAG